MPQKRNRERKIDKKRGVFVKVKGLQDQGVEIGQSTIWNHGEEHVQDQEVSLWIFDSMPHLVVLPLNGLDTSHV
ncbi:hypothetical protein OGAPHI_004676 [Ogataea philodendri]|uniref:Uncharacterized protein n=1 Tax=Ogataea philodendri TaxID=1378263 RepID=A0A9P8P2F2_9ASCO|nr:uncharacterized protein OGAPHI_004676 [Ogataea philodendri]KAH3663962.1 hypothetical protein OGAPHI_004676 [Ogataea philodendri]